MSGGPGNRGSLRLADLAVRAERLTAWCEQCGHRRAFATAELMARAPQAATLAQLARRMVCGVCGSRDVQLRPDYGGLGVVAGHHRPEE